MLWCVAFERRSPRKLTVGLPGSSGGSLRWRLILGTEALQTGRGLDQRAIHGEVLIAEQVPLVGLPDHRVEELPGDVVLQQPLTVLGERRVVKAGFDQRSCPETSGTAGRSPMPHRTLARCAPSTG